MYILELHGVSAIGHLMSWLNVSLEVNLPNFIGYTPKKIATKIITEIRTSYSSFNLFLTRSYFGSDPNINTPSLF